MSLTEKDIVKEYIQLSIEQKLENRPNSNYLEKMLNKHINNEIIKENSKGLLDLKKEIDDLIARKIGSFENINDLKIPGKKIEAIESVLNEIDRLKVKEFGRVLKIKKDTDEDDIDDDMNFDANLILSTVFIPVQEKENEKTLKESVILTNPNFNKSSLNISKIDLDFKKINFKKFNSQKLLSFFEMIKNYNFDFNFREEDKKLFEGILTLIINSNEKFLNEFIFKDYFLNFVEKFTERFSTDFQVQIEHFDFQISPHVILICSYNSNLYHYMDKRCFLENLCEKIDEIKKEDLHFYLKIFINFLKCDKKFFTKFLFLKLIDKFFNFLIEDDDLNTLSLFLKLLNILSEFKINPRKYISDKNKDILLARIDGFFEDLKIKVLSFKFKNNKINFSPNQTDSYLLLKLFIESKKNLILEVMTIQEYKKTFFLASCLLEFFSKNSKMIKQEDYEKITIYIFYFVNNFFYVIEIVNLGISAFQNYLNKNTYSYIQDELEFSEFLNNIISPFERAPITQKSLPDLELIQDFLLKFLDISILKCIGVNQKLIFTLLNFIFSIRKIIHVFHSELKKKYLQKGLVKYISKVNSEFKDRMENQLETILSKNALILQNLCSDNALTQSIQYFMKLSPSVTFVVYQDGKLHKEKIVGLLEDSIKTIYLITNLKLTEELKTSLGNYTLFMIKRLEEFIIHLKDEKIDVNFEIMKNVLEYLVLVIHYVKTYDEESKKEGSQMILERAFRVFGLIFFDLKHFLDLNSNCEIYVFLENFNHFWFAYFSFDYKFYDRINNFFFLEKVGKLSEKSKSKSKINFDDSLKKQILNFLNELIDLKSKCPFLNFIILKQLDIIFNTFETFSKLNREFIIKIFQKALDFSYSSDIHKIESNFLFNFSFEILSVKEMQEIFINFIYQNNLYINNFINDLVRNCIDKNFKTQKIKHLSKHSHYLLRNKLYNEDLPDKKGFTNFLFSLAQSNIKNKNLFQDVIILIKKYFQKYPNEYNRSLALQLFSNQRIYMKLLILLKKDKINLSMVMKNFLKIIKFFNIQKESNVPESLIQNIWISDNIHFLEEVYTELLDFILKKNIYKEYETEISSYLFKAKYYLDNCLFFMDKFFFYNINIKSIYYCLKIFSRTEKLVDDILNINSNEFVIKYILQIFEENSKIEFNKENNLYNYFKNFNLENIKNNDYVNKYEKKMIVLLLEILQNQKFEELERNDYLISTIIKFCIYIMGSYPVEDFQELFFKYIILNLRSQKSKKMSMDFYMILYNNFGLESNEVKVIFDLIFFINNDILQTFNDLCDKIKIVPEVLDLSAYNNLIRNLLSIYYLINTSHNELQAEDFLNLITALDFYMKNHYDNISENDKVEKLFVEIYIMLGRHKTIHSLTSANIFLEIFINKIDFTLGNKIEKFIYMGLFDSFFSKYNRKTNMILNKENLEYFHKFTLREKLKSKFEIFKIEAEPLNLIIKQLNFEDLNLLNETLISRCLRNISYFNKEVINSLDFEDVCFDLKLRQTIEILENLENLTAENQEIFRRRIEIIIFIIDKNKKEEDSTKLKNFFSKIMKLIEVMGENVKMVEMINRKGFTKSMKKYIIHCFLRLIKKSYYLASLKSNSAFKKNLLKILNSFFIPAEEDIQKSELMTFTNSHILYLILKFLRNKYDQIRISLNDEIIENIFKIFTADILKKIEIDENNNDKSVVAKTVIDLSKIEIKDLEFNKEMKLESYIEFSLYAFVVLSKNRLLLRDDLKEDVFKALEKNKENFQINELSNFLYTKLEEEYKKGGMVFKSEEDNLSSLESKQKNLLYVARMFLKLHSNLITKQNFTPAEFNYLNFTLKALDTHINENLDFEIFMKFEFIPVLCDFFVHDKIDERNKLKIIDLLKNYLVLTKYENNIDFNKMQNFFNFYKIFLEDRYLDISRKYFLLLEMMIVYLKMDQEFINQYFSEMNDKIFRTKSEITEQIFIGCLFVYTEILKKYEVDFQFDDISNQVYNFLKINHKRMELEEKGLLSEVIAHMKKHTTNIDYLKYNNMILFLKLQYNEESLRQVNRVNKSIRNLVDNAEDFQDILRNLGFEVYFKLIMKKFGKLAPTALDIGQLFLYYTYKMDKNRFDMFETLKNILSYIDFYYAVENKKLVLIFYKCLVNASLVKQNAEFLVKNKLYLTINKNFYRNDKEFYFIIISLIFNITYILNEEEFDIKDLLDDELMRLVIEIFKDCLENRYTKIIDQLIDIFISFIQHHISQLFNNQVISKLKLALNFYYNNEPLLVRILTVIKDLSIGKDKKIENDLIRNFDYLFLFHIHFRHLKNQKINSLIKHIIYNLIKIQDKTNKENDLVLFGIPESIIHTFTLDDDQDTIIINLKIILYSVKYDKCMLFIINYFMTFLRIIAFQEHPNITDSILFIALEILYEIIIFFRNPEIINSSFYFDDLKRLFIMMDFFKNEEKFLFVVVKLIKSLLLIDKENINLIDEASQDILNLIMNLRNNIKDQTIIYDIYDINNLINFQKTINENKLDIFQIKGELTADDKQVLDRGENIILIYNQVIHKRAFIKYDFLNNTLVIDNVTHFDKVKNKEKDKFIIDLKRLDKVNQFNHAELNAFEETFKTFFNKNIERNLFFNIKFWTYQDQNLYLETIYLTFDNEFKGKKWRNLIDILSKNK